MDLFVLFLLFYLGIGMWTVGYIPRLIENRTQQLMIIKSALITQISYYKELTISESEKNKKMKQKQEVEEELEFYKQMRVDVKKDSFLFKIFFLWFVYLPKFLAVKN
jgi:hypothetical protein